MLPNTADDEHFRNAKDQVWILNVDVDVSNLTKTKTWKLAPKLIRLSRINCVRNRRISFTFKWCFSPCDNNVCVYRQKQWRPARKSSAHAFCHAINIRGELEVLELWNLSNEAWIWTMWSNSWMGKRNEKPNRNEKLHSLEQSIGIMTTVRRCTTSFLC